MFKQITILGPGLLGASLAMRCKEGALCDRLVVGSRRPENQDACLAEDWCNAAFGDPKEAVKGSDLVIICTPVDAIPALLERIAPVLEKGTLVMDVGSTKQAICAAAEELALKTYNFVGAHPMAGSEKTGLLHARTNLFEDAACIITPTDKTDPEALKCAQTFWRAIGTRVYSMSPEAHDQTVASISHLPHLLASALCHEISRQDPIWPQLSGPGLRDTTRVAAGDPELWQQILLQNRASLLKAMSGFEASLADFKSALECNDAKAIRDLLEKGKVFRDQLNHD
ncbi:MAG: prephenate dehydrogenase/arogenate dehydrogenase family protein [Verrucomicrobia bacterium]|nr:prephenate dehydrogenase/arogenate dehydrogenase family protein [Verrucomicrobiota bacterium]